MTKFFLSPSTLVFALLVASNRVSAAETEPQQPTARFAIYEMAEGIHLAMNRGIGGANSGFVIGKTGVLVIDPQITSSASSELLAEIRKLTDKLAALQSSMAHFVKQVNLANSGGSDQPLTPQQITDLAGPLLSDPTGMAKLILEQINEKAGQP